VEAAQCGGGITKQNLNEEIILPEELLEFLPKTFAARIQFPDSAWFPFCDPSSF